MFEVDAFAKCKYVNGTQKREHWNKKTNDINNNNRDDATDRPIPLNTEATPDAAVFAGADPTPTTGAVSGGVFIAIRRQMWGFWRRGGFPHRERRLRISLWGIKLTGWTRTCLRRTVTWQQGGFWWIHAFQRRGGLRWRRIKLRYEEDGDYNEDEDEEEEWYEISDRNFAPDPALPLDIPLLSWENGDMIAKNAYWISLLPNVTEYLVSYCEEVGITNLPQD